LILEETKADTRIGQGGLETRRWRSRYVDSCSAVFAQASDNGKTNQQDRGSATAVRRRKIRAIATPRGKEPVRTDEEKSAIERNPRHSDREKRNYCEVEN
jgi:hypothetical protein